MHPADSGVMEQNVVHQGRPEIELLEINVNIRDAGSPCDSIERNGETV